MPLYFTTYLSNRGIKNPAVAALGGTTLFAWTGREKRLHLCGLAEIYPQGFTLLDVHVSEERSDAAPALAAHAGQFYLAWKGDGNDLLNLARVVVEAGSPSPKVIGLVDKETFQEEGRAPLSLIGFEDRLLLGYKARGKTCYAAVGLMDSTRADPISAVGRPPEGMDYACEIKVITADDERYLISHGDLWDNAGRLPSRDSLVMGPGWYSLFLALKEGKPEVYHAGNSDEWQALAGDHTQWDEQGDLAFADQSSDEETAWPRYWHWVGFSYPNAVKRQAAALANLDQKSLRDKYDALAQTEFASRRSDADFQAAWEALSQLLAFLRRAAEQDAYVLCRFRVPADPVPVLSELELAPLRPLTPEQAATLAPERLDILRRAMDSFGVESNAPANEWPFNILSRRTVAYGSGRLASAGSPVLHDYDPAELERCRRIAAEVAARLGRLPIRSSDLDVFDPLCLPVNRGETVPEALTSEVVRAAFRGTLHPWAPITIESLETCGVRELGNEASMYGHRLRDVYLHNRVWADLTDWFAGLSEIKEAGYVTIEGGIDGVLAVRAIVGLTTAGSLAGVATVGLASGLSALVELADFHRELTALERDQCPGWRDAKTNRVIARGILRSFAPATFSEWNARTGEAAERLREANRPGFWLATFRQLAPLRAVSLSPIWATVHRCLTIGRFTPETVGVGIHAFFSFGSFAEGQLRSFDVEEVRQIADALAPLDAAWLRRRYDDLRATDYADQMSEADYEATRAALEEIQAFYRQAADGGEVVVFECTPRSEEEIQHAGSVSPHSIRASKKSSGTP